LAATIIVANNLLIPIYGIEGAAYGSALALVLFNFVKYIFIYVKLKLQPFSKATLKVTGIAVIVVGMNYLIPKMDWVILDLLARSSAIAIVYSFLIFASKASPDGNQVFHKVLIFVGFKSE